MCGDCLKQLGRESVSCKQADDHHAGPPPPRSDQVTILGYGRALKQRRQTGKLVIDVSRVARAVRQTS